MNNTKLIIAPNAGFCNRLRSMVSAIYLAEILKINIEHLWIGTPYYCANQNIQNIHDKSFEYFFKPLINKCDYTKTKVTKVYTEWMPGTNWYNYQSYGQKLIQITNCLPLNLVNVEMDTSEHFLIETSYINNLNMLESDKKKIYKKYFIPNDVFVKEINNIPDFTNIIGISIRKGDFTIYFPETQFDDNIIIKWIHYLNDTNHKIFFCSDDKLFEKQIRNLIKNAIIPNYTNSDIDFLNFILLSKCVKIYGTCKSSYAEEASYFGDTEYIPLTSLFFNFLEND